MEYQTNNAASRIHPLAAGAAISVMLVSLVGVAAITGLIPSTHGTVSPAVSTNSEISTAPAVNTAKVAPPAPLTLLTATRYVSADGQVFDAVPNTNQLTPVNSAQAPSVTKARTPTPTVHHHTVRHVARNTNIQPVQSRYAQNYYNQPVRTAERPYYPPQQQHPIQNYVSDMHPVGTGVGAVVGGLLGNQVGGGNGKKLATVAGVLLGGYTGNEVSHNRNPLVP